MTGPAPRVVICDDAPGYRLLVQTILTEAGFEVAGVAGDWDEAAQRVTETRPDAVLLDLWLPNFDLDEVGRVCAQADGALVAIVTALSEPEARRMLEGVDGVDLIFSKREPVDTLVAALRERLPHAPPPRSAS